MRILLAFDKFKDALTAREACEIASRAIRGGNRDWELDLCPLTDGGEGFCETLTRAAKGTQTTVKVAGPRGDLVDAPLGIVPAESIAPAAREKLGVDGGTRVGIVEMAAASGLMLLENERRDPWQAGTYGTGQLIRAASESGAGSILLGLGGSATNDLGLGALAALGFEFRAADGGKLRPPIPARWSGLERIEGQLFEAIPPIRIACDVSNPLLGPRGATTVFGPQKGLRAGDVSRFESEAVRIADLLCRHCGKPQSLAETPGAGAAGGIGFGLMAAADAKLIPGFDLVSDWLDLSRRIARADVVITGEGRFDSTSLGGKGPGGVAEAARKAGKVVHVFAGSLGVPAGDGFHAITPPGMPLNEALRRAPELLAAAIAATFPGTKA